MTELLITVIMPVYNGSQFLDLAVKSVIRQTYRHWELFLIDDGSTDNSLLLMNEWAKIDSRIKVLFHQDHVNRGVSATRNLGINNAHGEYIALLDCDDEWLSDKLEKQICIFEEHPEAVLVYSKAVSVDEEGVELAKSIHSFDFPHICGTGLPNSKDGIIAGMIIGPVWMPALTVTMKTDSVKNLGGFDDTLKLQAEDHLLFTLLVANGSAYFIDEVLAKYRVHQKSFTQTMQWRYSMLEYYDRLYDKLPSSYRKTITAARINQVVGDLITIKSFSTLTGSIIAAKTVVNELTNYRIKTVEKIRLIFRLIQILLKELWHEFSIIPITFFKQYHK